MRYITAICARKIIYNSITALFNEDIYGSKNYNQFGKWCISHVCVLQAETIHTSYCLLGDNPHM